MSEVVAATLGGLKGKDPQGVKKQLEAHRFIMRQAAESLVALEDGDAEFEIKARRVLEDALKKTADQDLDAD